MELPGLPAVQQPQAVGIDLLLFEVDLPRRADVLLDPGVFNRLGVDAEQTLRQVPERRRDTFWTARM